MKEQTLTTVWLNHEMRPYLLRYPAIAMSAANHVRVSHATASPKHSFHVTTPVIRRTDSPRIAAVTASTFRIPPNIHSPTWFHDQITTFQFSIIHSFCSKEGFQITIDFNFCGKTWCMIRWRVGLLAFGLFQDNCWTWKQIIELNNFKKHVCWDTFFWDKQY